MPPRIARYLVVQPLAAGGMGEVFLARDERLDRPVAIKLMRAGFDTEELRLRFEEEARHVARLTHPNIVTIHEYGEHDGRPYIVMEYVAGHSLADIIRHRTPLAIARRVRLVEELCAGLAHAHAAHLVHRDVKPANLMVTSSGMLKVLDFGIAKLRGIDRTQQGMLVGTVNYMSPEQLQGKPVDHRSDVFAVGAVLYEVLTYEQAFKGDLSTAMYRIIHGQPDPLGARLPGLDPGFQAVVDRCLAKEPSERYQDLDRLKRDLAKLRRRLDAGEGGAADTMPPLDIEKTVALAPGSPDTGRPSGGAGPDTARAIGSALQSGEAALADGQFESAVRYARQALALDAGNTAARELIARAEHARDAAGPTVRTPPPVSEPPPVAVPPPGVPPPVPTTTTAARRQVDWRVAAGIGTAAIALTVLAVVSWPQGARHGAAPASPDPDATAPTPVATAPAPASAAAAVPDSMPASTPAVTPLASQPAVQPQTPAALATTAAPPASTETTSSRAAATPARRREADTPPATASPVDTPTPPAPEMPASTDAAATPAATAPASSTPERPAPERPATAVETDADRKAVLGLVAAFGRRFAADDLAGLRAIWPSMNRTDEDRLERAFERWPRADYEGFGDVAIQPPTTFTRTGEERSLEAVAVDFNLEFFRRRRRGVQPGSDQAPLRLYVDRDAATGAWVIVDIHARAPR